MATLHVFASFESFQRGLSVIGAMDGADSVLLRADALYQLTSGAEFGERCHGLIADALARGLDPAQFEHIHWVDYAGWVDLVTDHKASIDW